MSTVYLTDDSGNLVTDDEGNPFAVVLFEQETALDVLRDIRDTLLDIKEMMLQ